MKRPEPISEARIAELRAMPYAGYLRTQEWLRRRIVHLQACNYRCQLCNGNERLQVHHRTYERVGCEQWSDLVVLCSECQTLFHQNRRLVEVH